MLNAENQNTKSVAEMLGDDQGKPPGEMNRFQDRLPLARSRSESSLSASQSVSLNNFDLGRRNNLRPPEGTDTHLEDLQNFMKSLKPAEEATEALPLFTRGI